MAGGTGGVSIATFNIAWSAVADLQIGDKVIIPWVHLNTSVLTPPVALTELSRNNDGGCQVVWYGRTIDGSESGNLVFTTDIAQRMIAEVLHYRGVLLPFNDIDYIQEVGILATPMTHTAPTSHPVPQDAVIVTSYAERTGTVNTMGTLTLPAGYTLRQESVSAGSGGTFISTCDDGGTTPHPANTDVTPGPWTCPIGSTTALMTSIALARG